MSTAPADSSAASSMGDNNGTDGTTYSGQPTSTDNSLNGKAQASIKHGNNTYPVPPPMPIANAQGMQSMPQDLNAQAQWAQTAAKLQQARNFGYLNQ